MGQIGRDDIEALEFRCVAWFPKVLVMKCVQLLKQCKTLRFLVLYLWIRSDAFKTDPSVQALCSIRGMERVEIRDISIGTGELPEHCDLAKWLNEEMEASGRIEREDED